MTLFSLFSYSMFSFFSYADFGIAALNEAENVDTPLPASFIAFASLSLAAQAQACVVTEKVP